MATPRLPQHRRELARRLDTEYVALSTMILATPTGPQRNDLCDAQIHLLAAIDLIKVGRADEPA